MKIPQLAMPVERNYAVLRQTIENSSGAIAASAKKDITGKAVCRNGGTVLATYSETICTNDNHDGCSAAKIAAVTNNQAACNALGGILTQSSSPCQVGAKC